MKSDKLYECIKYCEEQNGMPVCKNCGIDEDAIKEALEEAYERGVKAGIVIGEDNTIRYMEYAIQPAKNPLGTSKEDVFYSRKDLISFIEVLKNI